MNDPREQDWTFARIGNRFEIGEPWPDDDPARPPRHAIGKVVATTTGNGELAEREAALLAVSPRLYRALRTLWLCPAVRATDDPESVEAAEEAEAALLQATGM